MIVALVTDDKMICARGTRKGLKECFYQCKDLLVGEVCQNNLHIHIQIKLFIQKIPSSYKNNTDYIIV